MALQVGVAILLSCPRWRRNCSLAMDWSRIGNANADADAKGEKARPGNNANAEGEVKGRERKCGGWKRNSFRRIIVRILYRKFGHASPHDFRPAKFTQTRKSQLCGAGWRERGKSRSWHFRPHSFSISPLSSKYILYLIQLELITVRITLLLRAVFKLSASTSC